jgi:hypothetical protein
VARLGQDTDLSLTSVTALLLGPQYAVTSTSSWLHAAVQVAVSQLVRMTRREPPPAAAGGPGGPAGPGSPCGPCGPGGPGGPASPFSPAGPAAPVSPLGPGFPCPQLAKQRENAMATAIRFVCMSLDLFTTTVPTRQRDDLSGTYEHVPLRRSAQDAGNGGRAVAREGPGEVFTGALALPWALRGQWGLPGTPQGYRPAGGLVPADASPSCANRWWCPRHTHAAGTNARRATLAAFATRGHAA